PCDASTGCAARDDSAYWRNLFRRDGWSIKAIARGWTPRDYKGLNFTAWLTSVTRTVVDHAPKVG
ncbi:MAG: hypothetical protein QM655_08760, partial [Nocardioidaceae bacterium]